MKQAKTLSRKSLKDRITGRMDIADLAFEYPLQWLDEANDNGSLAPGPGLGKRAVLMNTDCSMASGFSVSCNDPIYSGDSYLESIHDRMKMALSSLEHDEHLQFIFTTWDEDNELYQRANRVRPDDPAYTSWWRTNRTMRDRDRLFTGDLRSFRTYCFLNRMPEVGRITVNPYQIDGGGITKLWGAFDMLVKASTIIQENFNSMDYPNYTHSVEKLIKRTKDLSALMTNNGLLTSTPTSAREVFNLCRKFWAPTRWQQDRTGEGFWQHKLPSLDPKAAPLAAYFILDNIVDEGHQFWVGDVCHRILMMNVLPESCFFSGLSSSLISGDGAKDGAGLRSITNLSAILTLKPMDKQAEMKRLKSQVKLLQAQLASGDLTFADNEVVLNPLVRRMQELKVSTKAYLYNATFMVHIWHKSTDVLDSWESLIKGNVDRVTGAVLERDSINAFPYYIGLGQPGFTRKDDNERAHPVGPEEAAMLVPTAIHSHGCVKSNPKEDVPIVFETELGTPYGFDLFSDRVFAPGGFGVGGTGSGKSNFYNFLVKAYHNRNCNILIMDGAVANGSFRPICSTLGGTYFDGKSDLCFNVMHTRVVNGTQMPPTADELNSMLISFNAMLRPPGNPLKPFEQGIIASAIRHAFENRVDRTGFVWLEHVLPGLESIQKNSNDSKEKELANEFHRVIKSIWVDRSRFGSYVNGPHRFPTNKLMVFDLKHLLDPSKAQLRAVIVTIIFRYLDEITAANENKPINERNRTLFICDEAWSVLMDPFMSTMISGVYRAGRARWISAHCLSQSFSDMEHLLKLTSNDNGPQAGVAENSPIVSQSGHVFIFNISEQDADRIKTVFKLSDRQVEMLSKLTGKAGEYRQFVHLLKVANEAQPRIFTLLRSRVSAQELWVTSTRPEDDAERVSMRQKIEQMLADDPEVRERLILELANHGYPTDGITNEALIYCASIHYLSTDANAMKGLVARSGDSMKKKKAKSALGSLTAA